MDVVKAKNQLKKTTDKLLHKNTFFYTLLRSSVSSQVCGWIDTLTSFLVFALFHLSAWLSTAIGAFVGGIFNYIVNYRFTFHADGIDWRTALTKFLFVWAGSLLLNSFGTQIVYSWVNGWQWLEEETRFFFSENGVYLVARLFVALMVSLCWNFLLQRNFVFKQTRLDPYITKTLDKLGFGSKKSNLRKNAIKNKQ